MLFRLIVLAISLGFCIPTFAQPSNDDCHNAITLPISSNWCSAVGAYTNVNATPSNFPPAPCFGNTGGDVWFRFTAVGTDLNITIIGDQAPSAGGSLQRPQVALYSGTCTSSGGNLSLWQCRSATGVNNIVDLYKGALVIGQSYLIRVQGNFNNTGTFQICAQNYNAPALPGSDCNTASVLCDKSSFVVQSVVGAGNDPDEAASSCLGGLGGNSESNSTWFKWTCDQAGSLSFTLTPNNPSDDLDFVLYELPNGINNCAGKNILRCMAAGESLNNYPSPCHGPTGLNFTATDVTETSGCALGQDNWLSAVNLIAGRSYALVVNNFSATGNGFQMDFGGTATFQGPTADFTVNNPPNGCASETWTFTDNSSFAFGNLTAWSWTFGTGASPATANTQGPHQVTYNTPGQKSVVLSVETNEGCLVTHVVLIQVDSCCQTVNALQYTTAATDVLCRDNPNGTVNVTPSTTHLTPYSYRWSTGNTNSSLNNLLVGNYSVTISNGICNSIDTLSVGGPPPWELTDSITRPTCDGGTDGAIQVLTANGSNGAPYQYNWNNTGFNSNASYTNLSNGVYSLVLQDAQGCDTTISYTVHELELELDSIGSGIIHPSCHGYSDGSIQVAGQNGLAPYSYIWNHNATGAFLYNLPAGTYYLDTIWDANRCRNWAPFSFTLTAPDSIQIVLDSVSVSCTGNPDGQLIPIVTGGTYAYQYQWSNFQQDSMATHLGAGNYNLTVTDAHNCTKTIAASLTEPPLLKVDYEVRDVSCYGYSNGLIRIKGQGGTPDPNGLYTYSMSPNNFSALDSFEVAAGTSYSLYVQDAAGCIANYSPVVVNEPDLLIVDAGPDTTIQLGDHFDVEAQLSFFDYYDYQWSINTGDIACPTCRKTSIQPVEDQKYYSILVTTAAGCTATDSLLVTVEKERNLFIPNAFSPNGDGNNDYHDVYTGEDVYQIKKYLVFDRWGNMVCNKQNIPRHWKNFGWDGRFRGQDMQTGVYVYMIEVEFIDGVIVRYSGDLSLFN
ncbi:T9SS type B sorting domain-containing protein [Aureispira anguillae]|uniref:Gliding motility-associated C-terminal domain-containing protein n=1 Tax=Aureispira anguillae TaxID=2864201 RepID=A0A916DUP7_9BACT|nr:gliding motility-associated C-terminal domain-containing protein [Aureispira anguillae]BDS12897.1 gliding motility-associated C-terminal domain-containing protein [Aureispira anguillae]